MKVAQASRLLPGKGKQAGRLFYFSPKRFHKRYNPVDPEHPVKKTLLYCPLPSAQLCEDLRIKYSLSSLCALGGFAWNRFLDDRKTMDPQITDLCRWMSRITAILIMAGEHAKAVDYERTPSRGPFVVQPKAVVLKNPLPLRCKPVRK